jgi:uncharacterized RDD family membrane protein YckC
MSEDHQRYAPPQAEVANVETPLDANAPLASRGRRLATFALDFAFFHVLAALIGFVLALSGAGDSIERLTGVQERVFGIAVFLAYYLLTEMLSGRSLGKRFTGTRVVTAGGRAPSKGQLTKRSFARLVPFEFLSIFRASRSMWHDDWSGTRTVFVPNR